MKNRNSLPENAKQVFKGIIFDVWQWQEKLYDGQSATYELVRRPNTAQVIAVANDKIILQIEEQPNAKKSFPSIPGGRLNEGEDPLDAAKREMLEETGYTSTDWQLWNQVEPVAKMDWTVYTYIARNCVLDEKPDLDPGEKIETRLVGLDEFMTIATEDPLFYSPEIVPDLLRIRFDTGKMAAFKKILFGKRNY